MLLEAAMTEAVEAIKIALKQEPEGIVVSFRIQPEHFPEHLLIARINARFALAFQEIDDDEKPKPADPELKNKRRQNANVMRAGILCGQEGFQTFLRKRYRKEWDGALGEGKEQTADALRAVLGVESRREIGTEAWALKRFDKLEAEYLRWKEGQ
jgi:hypothetical protein